MKADGSGDGGLLGAGGEAEGCVLYIASGDDDVRVRFVSAGKQQRGADAEVTIGCVGVVGYSEGALLQLRELCRA